MDLPRGAYNDVVSAIGETPLIRLNRVTSHLTSSEVWVKLERCNPGGSIKDRIGLHMVLDAEKTDYSSPGEPLWKLRAGTQESV